VGPRPYNELPADSMRIALVSTAKMERLNLLFHRSDLLLQSVGGRPYKETNQDGVKFTWTNHYLVYGWIPARCIVTTFTLAEFRMVCEDRNIGQGQPLHVGSILHNLDSCNTTLYFFSSFLSFESI